MALRAYTQDEIFNSSIGDDVYLQPDVDKEIVDIRNIARNIAELNKMLTRDNIKLKEEIDKLKDEIDKLRNKKN